MANQYKQNGVFHTNRFWALFIGTLAPAFLWVDTSLSESKYEQALKAEILMGLGTVNTAVQSVGQPPCVNCTVSMGQSNQDQCQKRYDELFKDGELKVHIALGYMDYHMTADSEVKPELLAARDIVIDRYVQEALINKLMAKCSTNATACGFVRAEDDAITLVRTAESGRAESTPVRIRLSRSSYTHSDTHNRVDGKSEQRQVSETARNDFKDALAGEADVVIYAGHMRHGAAFWEGAGFYPPVLIDRVLHNDSIGTATSEISCPPDAPRRQFEQYNPASSMDPLTNKSCYQLNKGSVDDLSYLSSAKFVAIFACDPNTYLSDKISRMVDPQKTSLLLADGFPPSLQHLPTLVLATFGIGTRFPSRVVACQT